MRLLACTPYALSRSRSVSEWPPSLQSNGSLDGGSDEKGKAGGNGTVVGVVGTEGIVGNGGIGGKVAFAIVGAEGNGGKGGFGSG